MANPKRQATECELAYLAGIIDGEGCISMFETENTSGRSIRYKVTVAMVDHEPASLLAEVFGGSLYFEKKLRNGARFPQVSWCVTERRATNAVIQLIPYLRVKRKQGELLLMMAESTSRYARGGRGYFVPESEKQERRDLIAKVRAANQREHLVGTVVM